MYIYIYLDTHIYIYILSIYKYIIEGAPSNISRISYFTPVKAIVFSAIYKGESFHSIESVALVFWEQPGLGQICQAGSAHDGGSASGFLRHDKCVVDRVEVGKMLKGEKKTEGKLGIDI